MTTADNDDVEFSGCACWCELAVNGGGGDGGATSGHLTLLRVALILW